jgi:hypothetical protein
MNLETMVPIEKLMGRQQISADKNDPLTRLESWASAVARLR